MSILSGDVLFNVSAIIVGVITLIVIYIKWSLQYWKNRGVPYLEPHFLWGNLDPPFKRSVPLADELRELFRKARKNGWKELGFYNMIQPIYMPIDLDILKHILTKDFNHFFDRGIYINEPISHHLFNIGGKKWKNLRAKFTPTFTTGKLKGMFKTITATANIMNNYLLEEVTGNEPIDIKNVLGNFSTDVIGSCAFGLECNSFKDPNTPFRKMGKRALKNTRFETVKLVFADIFPKIAKFLNVRVFPLDVNHFFTDVVIDTVSYREKNNVHRNDFLQLLMDIKNNKTGMGQAGDGSELTMDEMVAQSFVLFLGGFETSSTTMTFALFELSRNQEVQQKVRDEINQVLKKYNGEITYDSLTDMKYLSQVLDETLRMYPAVPFVTRKCMEEYTVPETGLKIEVGTRVWIPIRGIHYDEEYYPNPEVFDPERFSDENKLERNPYAHIPFGEGPRLCIGMRFGILQSKVGLVNVLKNFKVTLNEKTQVPLKFDVDNLVPGINEGIWLNMEKIA